jgi:hypothetical protein
MIQKGASRSRQGEGSGVSGLMFNPDRLWTARLPLAGEVLRLGNLLRTH